MVRGVCAGARCERNVGKIPHTKLEDHQKNASHRVIPLKAEFENEFREY